MRTSLIVLVLAVAARAESWPTFEEYVRSCTRIVKARIAGKHGRGLRFELIESWKGKPVSRDEEYVASPAAHAVRANAGEEVVLFFLEGKRHSSSFPIRGGRIVYGEASLDDGVRRSYPVAEFRDRVRILQLPMAATADGEFRLQAQGVKTGAAGRPLQFEIERAGSRWLGSEIHFDEVETTVEATVGGKPVAGLRAQAGTWPSSSPRIEVYGLPDGATFDSLVLKCGIIHVVASKAYRFDKLSQGKSAELSAPPFSFQVESKPTRATILCSLVRDEKLRAIEKALDTQTITPMWALGALSLIDGKSRSLQPREGGGTHRGFAYGFALADPPGTPLQFPLSLAIRIPTRIKKERLRFEFRDFKLKR